MTKFNLFAAGVAALTLTLGFSSAALAKPDYLDRMTPKPKPAAQAERCDCPMMRAGAASVSDCMAPSGPGPKSAPKG